MLLLKSCSSHENILGFKRPFQDRAHSDFTKQLIGGGRGGGREGLGAQESSMSICPEELDCFNLLSQTHAGLC